MSDDEYTLHGEVTKLDDDRRLAFGWASVIQKDGTEVVDLQNDAIELGPMEDAVYKYVLESRDADEMHKRTGVGRLVESVLLTPEKIEKMGLSGSGVPVGWWVGFRVDDDEVWKGVKSGRYRMFSIAGRGRRKRRDSE